MIQVFTLSMPAVDFRSQAKISPDDFCICVNFKGLTSSLFLLHDRQAFRGKMRCTLNLTSAIENEKDITS